MALPKICEKMVSKVLATTDKLAIKYLDGHSEEITKDTLSSVTGVKAKLKALIEKVRSTLPKPISVLVMFKTYPTISVP